MTELPLPAPPPVKPRLASGLRPTFLGALRGVWLLTWKSQMTLRRLPALLINLLILPVLVYITTASIESWMERHSQSAASLPQFEGLSRRLARAGHPLERDQISKLTQIYREEYARIESAPGPKHAAETSTDERTEQIKAAHSRIENRARGYLDERQLAQFQSFDQRRLQAELDSARQAVWGRTGPFYHWLVDLYFFVLLPLTCVRACGALIREDLQADTLGFLTTRPVSRAGLVIAKYFSQTAWLQMLLLAQTGALFLVGALRQMPALGGLLPLFLGAQFLAVFAWSALGTFLGLASKRYMALALVYGLLVEMGIGRIPTNVNTLSLMRHLKSLLSRNDALQHIYDWPARGVPLSVAALIAATAIFLGLAAMLFTFKEYHHTMEMQK